MRILDAIVIIGVLLVAKPSAQCPSQDHTDGAKDGACESTKNSNGNRILSLGSASRCKGQRSFAHTACCPRTSSAAIVLRSIARNAGRVEVVHTIATAARLWVRMLNLPRSPCTEAPVVTEAKLLAAKMALP